MTQLLWCGDFTVFFSRPLSLAPLIATAALVVIVALRRMRACGKQAGILVAGDIGTPACGAGALAAKFKQGETA